MNFLNKEKAYFKSHLMNKRKSNKLQLPKLNFTSNKNKSRQKKAPFLVPGYPQKKRLKKTKSMSLQMPRNFHDILKENKFRHKERKKRVNLSQSKKKLIRAVPSKKRKTWGLESIPLRPYQKGKWKDIQKLKLGFQGDTSLMVEEVDTPQPLVRVKKVGEGREDSEEHVRGSFDEVQIFLKQETRERVPSSESLVKKEIIREQQNIK
jgi:hypothetical protein